MKFGFRQVLQNKKVLNGHFLTGKGEIKKVYIKKFIEPENSNFEKTKVSDIKRTDFKFDNKNYQKEYDLIMSSEIKSAVFFEYSFTEDHIENELLEAFMNVYENMETKSHLIVHLRNYNHDYSDSIGPKLRNLIKLDKDASPITATINKSKSKTQKVDLLLLIFI
jgi:hypothetical protein